MDDDKTKLLTAQNDRFRSDPFTSGLSGRVMITPGVSAMSDIDQTKIFERVQTFEHFTQDNDPYGEHDFGAFDYKGQKIFWKIDYYDTHYQMGSENPTDPTVTRRVLTIMLAEEY